jgi:hypothetical protein
MAVGVSPLGAALVIAMVGTVYLVLARIVAETGLIFVQLVVPVHRPWVFLLQDMPAALAMRPSQATIFWTGMVGHTFAHDIRESLPPFSTHALRVNDVAAYDRPGHGKGYGLFAAMAVALVVGFVVAGASTLLVEYSYATPLARGATTVLNGYGVDGTPQYQVLDPALSFRPPNNGPKETHSHMGYLSAGIAVAGALSVLRLRFVSWPLHPIGFLLCFGFPIKMIWFSIFLGWLTKVMVVKFGGSGVFKLARPVFIGLIIGEVSAASFWLIVSLVLNAMGREYHAILLLPG